MMYFFSYTDLANPELEPYAPNSYQSELVPGKKEVHVIRCFAPINFYKKNARNEYM